VTPVYGSETLSKQSGRRVVLKAENLQRTGSFKIRGAYNTLAQLSDAERSAGVVAASAGNHGQAVAWAARELGLGSTIFMPQDAPMAKVEATQNYGAQVILVGSGFDEAQAEAMARHVETGATFAHAFEDERAIAGQGTIGLELAEQIPEIETFLIPVGGGGLAAGTAIALRALHPGAKLIGVQAGLHGHTIADGIAVKHPGQLTMSILEDLLDELIEVDDEAISQAITMLLERSKLVVEGAGAVGVAALLSGQVGGTGPVCAVLSGGNIDPTLLITVMRHGLTVAGRYLVLRSRIADRPGELITLLNLVAHERANIISIEHHREGVTMNVAETTVDLTVVTRNEEHCQRLMRYLRDNGFPAERLG
jgi:threonine dehydratase